jgi:hypothetical protein
MMDASRHAEFAAGPGHQLPQGSTHSRGSPSTGSGRNTRRKWVTVAALSFACVAALRFATTTGKNYLPKNNPNEGIVRGLYSSANRTLGSNCSGGLMDDAQKEIARLQAEHAEEIISLENAYEEEIKQLKKQLLENSQHPVGEELTTRVESPLLTDGHGGEAAEKQLEYNSTSIIESKGRQQETRCAINLYGLPRAFSSLVLPFLKRNVIIPNAQYHCDYFIHFHYLRVEQQGRSSAGGKLNPDEILEVKDVIESVANDRRFSGKNGYTPTIEFFNRSDADFWSERAEFINKTHHARTTDGSNYLYYPWKKKTFNWDTMYNIVKMWDALECVWNLMEESAKRRNVVYDRVAMLRNDVLFVTPIYMYGPPAKMGWDLQIQGTVGNNNPRQFNTTAIIPAFQKFPINDRAVVGPYEAVRIWSSERFSLVGEHVKMIERKKPGFGIHDETFLNLTIFPEMINQGYSVVEDNEICFLRARPDLTIWKDCPCSLENIESVLGRKCRHSEFKSVGSNVRIFDCGDPTKIIATR